MSLLRIIVNADDLGECEATNHAIFDLMTKGKITSSTILANAEAVEHAARELKKLPNCSFGIHLNITAFRPLTADPALRPLLDENGQLVRRPIRPDKRLLQAIYGELSTQVEKLLKLGIPLSHLDSHHHTHTLPVLFPVIKALQRKFRLRRARSTINIYPDGEGMSAPLALQKKAFIWMQRHFVATRTPDWTTDFRTFYPRLNDRKNLPQGTLELMVHPGASGERYQKEKAQLETNWVNELDGKAQLISYNQL